MKKTYNIYRAIGSGVFAVAIMASAVAVYAATDAVMPALYNQSGQQVNSANTTAVAAGWYYLNTNASANSKVYYYGNGVYYDPTAGIYGGSAVKDPNGTAGVDLGYAASVLTSSASAPNTGLGGNATTNWLVLIVSGLVMMVGATYVVGKLAWDHPVA
ncbi:MAG: hypothetical protein KGI49_03310 [Patescibacteria group bacterium]|nr:hypothetical protein [Patescibacteria group bacterium]